MKWSQLKKRIEDTFAESVHGRVEVWNTRYRGSHDEEGEAWITIDKELAYSAATCTYHVRSYREAHRLMPEIDGPNFRDPDQTRRWASAWRDARKKCEVEGVFTSHDVNAALFAYLNMSIEEIIVSTNPIIRGVGMLDRRLGKRRITELDVEAQHPLVKMLHAFRCTAEGITTNHRELSNADKPRIQPSADQQVAGE